MKVNVAWEGGVGEVVILRRGIDDLAGEIFALDADGAVFGLDGYGVAVGYVAAYWSDSDAEGWGVAEDGFGELDFEFCRTQG